MGGYMMKKQQNKKKFIITIDTEGDNLWNYNLGDIIETRNADYLPRFQELCNEYQFKPVYLTNYEMINSSKFIDFVSKEAERGNCEIGMHLHAWNTPPEYNLSRKQKGAGLPYLIEYPKDIMEEKIVTMTELITQRTGQRPVSHRAGRWTMNQDYFDILIQQGYKIDCSVTPHINWKSSKGYTEHSVGSDYRKSCLNPMWIHQSNGEGKILEIPVTTYKKIIPHWYKGEGIKSLIKTGYSLVKPKVLWLRPTLNNVGDMLRVITINEKLGRDYLMFMIHSSELMPGGSPTFTSDDSISNLYLALKDIFTLINENYAGYMLKEV